MAEKRKKGDRFDGVLLRDEVPAMNRFSAYLLPNRTDCEAHITFEADTRPMDEFLKKKNAEFGDNKYTYFHLIMAALIKCFVLRPRMNRFISGNRIYERRRVSVAFVVKKRFEDKAQEALAFKEYGKKDSLTTLHRSITEEIGNCRREDLKDNSNGFMEKLMRLPHFILKIILRILFFLDRRGKVPYTLIKADPNYASIFLTNLGSIGMDSGYHHLNNWGTNSFFAVIGKRHFAPNWNSDGSYELRPVISIDFTLDERIGDGFYYAKTLELLKKILENPGLLEKPFDTPAE